MSGSNGYARVLIQVAEDKAVDDLVQEKLARTGYKKVKRNSISEKAASLASIGSTLNRDTLQKRVVRKFKSLQDERPILEVTTTQTQSEVSSLSSPSTGSASDGASEEPSNDTSSELITGQKGRPKGSTNEKKKHDEDQYTACIDAITYDYATEVTANRAKKKRCKKGFLASLIAEKKEKYGVASDIPEATIRSRAKRGNLNPKHRGTRSPLADAEKALVVICIQMGRIRQPLSCEEGIALMNDLIKNTAIQQEVKEFQLTRKLGSDEFEHGTLTKNWWRAFLKRHDHEIVTRRGERFACIRADWTKKSNLITMFDAIYDEMVVAKIAVKRDTPVFTDRDGNEVAENAIERYGYKQDIKITKPNYLMFADESGFSTSQKKDGHVGGRKYICEKGTIPQSLASTTDHKFTLLPFTSGSGEAVCCVVIFQSKTGEVPLLWNLGTDHRAGQPVRHEDGKINFELSMGEGKYLPGGPKCKFNGKEVDCLTYASESGGITGDILVKILEHFDKIDLFPRLEGGAIPMLIVDGHQSRLDPKFIEYINGQGHKWIVCLGVPYATSLWQVGDASEQNGKAKTEWTREKEIFLKWKLDRRLPRTIEATDIIPLLNRIFHQSYGNIASNKQAVSDRGWVPPNRVLLDHKQLVDDTKPSPAAISTSTPSGASNSNNASNSGSSSDVQLNLNNGSAATYLDRLIDERARSEGAKKAADERKRKGDEALQTLKEAKRLSSGVTTSVGIHSLRDPRFLEAFREKQRVNAEKESKKAANMRERLKKRVEGVKKLREKHGHERSHRFSKFGLTDCATYLQYKKQSKKDGAMPKDLPERRQRCLEWMERPSPTASPHASDDEGDDLPDGTGDATAVALGLPGGAGAGLWDCDGENEEMEDMDGHLA